MTISVSIAGATGWAGSALARGIAGTDDIRLVSAVSRSHAGGDLGQVLQEPRLAGVPIFGRVEEALAARPAVLVEYSLPDAAKHHVLTALDRGSQVVVGTSGLTDDDYREITARANATGRGVLACGNFALTVVLLQRFAEMAARMIPHWEVIDYAHDRKADAPSGTARELAHRLGQVRPGATASPPAEADQPSRGAAMGGSRVHSLRVPGFVLSTEVIFGLPGERLSLRNDSGDSAEPYVGGALIAIRKVGGLVGLHRGLDTVLDL
jgi:4-hydroxy-tetrahydrodipicolinate reductase